MTTYTLDEIRTWPPLVAAAADAALGVSYAFGKRLRTEGRDPLLWRLDHSDQHLDFSTKSDVGAATAKVALR